MKYITTKLLALAAIVIVSFSAVSAQSGGGFDRMNLEKKIRKEINMMPYYDVFDLIQFQLSPNGTVTLTGQVNRGSTRSGAVAGIKRLPGVTNVVNNIELASVSRFDEELRQRTYVALARQGRLGAYLQGVNPSMRILVNRGNITLGGFVNTQSEVNLAYIAARGVSGAFSVNNALIADRDRAR